MAQVLKDPCFVTHGSNRKDYKVHSHIVTDKKVVQGLNDTCFVTHGSNWKRFKQEKATSSIATL